MWGEGKIWRRVKECRRGRQWGGRKGRRRKWEEIKSWLWWRNHLVVTPGASSRVSGLVGPWLTLEEEAVPRWWSWYCGQHSRHAHWATLAAPIWKIKLREAWGTLLKGIRPCSKEVFTTDVANLRGNIKYDMQDQPSCQTSSILSLKVAPKSTS